MAERDYKEIVAALRRKAADKSVTPQERQALTDKANELAEKYDIRERTEQCETISSPLTSNIPTYTYEEYLEEIFLGARRYRHPNYPFEYGGYQSGKTHFQEEWLHTQPGMKFVVINVDPKGWQIIDEWPAQNEWSEFPQEGGIDE